MHRRRFGHACWYGQLGAAYGATAARRRVEDQKVKDEKHADVYTAGIFLGYVEGIADGLYVAVGTTGKPFPFVIPDGASYCAKVRDRRKVSGRASRAME